MSLHVSRTALAAFIAALVTGGCAAYPAGTGASARTFTLDVSPKVSAAYHALSALRDYDASDVDALVVTVAETNDAKAPTATQTLKRPAPGVTEPDLASALHFAGLRYGTDYTVRVEAFKGTGGARLAIGDTTAPVRFEAQDGVLDDSRAIAPTVSLATPVLSQSLETVGLSSSMLGQGAPATSGTGLRTAYDPQTHRYVAVWRQGTLIYHSTLDEAGRPIAGSSVLAFDNTRYPATGDPLIVYRGGSSPFLVLWPLIDNGSTAKYLGHYGLTPVTGTNGVTYTHPDLLQVKSSTIPVDLHAAADVATGTVAVAYQNQLTTPATTMLSFIVGTTVPKTWNYGTGYNHPSVIATGLGTAAEPRRFAAAAWLGSEQLVDITYFDRPDHYSGTFTFAAPAPRELAGAYDEADKQYVVALNRESDDAIVGYKLGADNTGTPSAPAVLAGAPEGVTSNLRLVANPAAQEFGLSWTVATPSGPAVRALRVPHALGGPGARFDAQASGAATAADLTFNPHLVQYLLSWTDPANQFTLNPIDCFVR